MGFATLQVAANTSMDALPDSTERDITDVIGIKRQMELLKGMIETRRG